MRRWLLLLAAACATVIAAGDPSPSDFAWRGTLATEGRIGLMRVAVPAEALARLQSRTAADLRLFDAQGRAVPFALAAPVQPAVQARDETAPYPAFPLYSATRSERRAAAVQVRIEDRGRQQSLWVDLGGQPAQPPADAQPIAAALFDMRAQKAPVTALLVRGRVPANVPVRFNVATSADLTRWSSVPVEGRVFHFEGAGAPANDRLELAAPLSLQGRYLQLEWGGQAGVQVDAVVGLLSPAQPPAALARVGLGAPVADGTTAAEWSLGFATPVRQLLLATGQANTLVPVRVLGRLQPSEPWRPLAQTLVYSIGPDDAKSRNAPVELGQPAVRWLRVEATHGAQLPPASLSAQVLFDPLDIVFLAGTAGPYRLAAGRADTPTAALPLGMLSATTATPVQELPAAHITRVESEPPAALEAGGRWLPAGVSRKTAGLWLVLAVGVLVLGAVAWSLLRQLHASPPET